jgi:hypothetical protein
MEEGMTFSLEQKHNPAAAVDAPIATTLHALRHALRATDQRRWTNNG